jgi:hypothetical protein
MTTFHLLPLDLRAVAGQGGSTLRCAHMATAFCKCSWRRREYGAPLPTKEMAWTCLTCGCVVAGPIDRWRLRRRKDSATDD